MPTSKNMISSLNTSLERLTPQQTNYHVHPTWTKETMTTKTKPSSDQNSLSTLSRPKSQIPRKETSWPSSTTTPLQDTLDATRQPEGLMKSCHGQECDNGSQTM